MNSLHILDNNQLSKTLIEAKIRKLNDDFLSLLKNEVISRLVHSSHCKLTSKNGLPTEQLLFNRELDRLYNEYTNCNDQVVRDQIYQDILLLESVLSIEH